MMPPLKMSRNTLAGPILYSSIPVLQGTSGWSQNSVQNTWEGDLDSQADGGVITEPYADHLTTLISLLIAVPADIDCGRSMVSPYSAPLPRPFPRRFAQLVRIR